MVPGEGVQKRDHSMFSSGVHYLVYSGQEKVVLRAGIIKVSVIDADLSFSPFFFETTTMFANHLGYSNSLINLAASNLFTSF